MRAPRGGMHQRGMGRPMMGMRCETHFDAFDSDGDSKLTLPEFAAWPHARGDADVLFAERDRDKDGSLTREEFCGPRTQP
jgi:Ca2+-binding EF-hand superfamily protein